MKKIMFAIIISMLALAGTAWAGVTAQRYILEQAPLTDTELRDRGLIDVHDAYEVSADGNTAGKMFIQDQTTPTVFVKANNVTGTDSLAVAAAVGDTQITVNDDSGVNTGDYLGIFSLDTDRFYVGTVYSKAGSNVLRLDNPVDSVFAIGDTVGTGVTNLAVNGSVTPQIFSLRGADPGIDVTVDITRIIITCTTSSDVDLTKFANIAPLTKGLLMRRTDGSIQNIINWKTNSEIAGSMFDWTVTATGVGQQGVDGFYSRLTFGGPSKIGVVLRVGPGENIEFFVQDNLSAISHLEIMLEGHVVQFFLPFLFGFRLRDEDYKEAA